MEGSLVAYKVFTNGSVLNASEINDNLMNQSVAVFSNEAARTAAITSPVEGQMTYLEDVDRYDHWNGSSWISPFGLTLIGTNTFTNVASFQFNNVFTSQFQNYKIIANITAVSGDPLIISRFRTVSGDDTSSNYLFQTQTASGSSITAGRTTLTYLEVGFAGSSRATTLDLSVYRPNEVSPTGITSQNSGSASSNPLIFGMAGSFTSTTQFTGISIISGGSNITGTARIYGLRN
jgi:hypothetical protein